MKKILLLTLAVAIFATTSCGEKAREAKEAMNAMKQLSESVDDMEKAAKKAEEKQKEREASGNTEAMHQDELFDMLPQSAAGWTYNEDAMEKMKMNEISTAKVGFKNGDAWATITVMDYPATHWAAAAAFFMAIEMENAEEKLSKIKTGDEDIVGIEHIYKKNDKTELIYGVGSRFLINIETQGTGGKDEAYKLAELIPMKKMKNM